ncbi:hypothetical protein ACJJI4_04270 [Microbulbifer sp. TRSA002]|uniref:hypothetical protein n=1 Tax=Microbulbifer sp. TRSA002 TaxID=3243382 RepID=UPI0040394E24
MGEWSEFFEDFPEYAPGPPSAEELEQEAKRKLKTEIRKMNSDAFALIEKTQEKEKKQYLEKVENCPQCGEKQLNVYKLKPDHVLCECQSCLTYGSGSDLSIAIQEIICANGDELNWKNSSLFKVLQNKN